MAEWYRANEERHGVPIGTELATKASIDWDKSAPGIKFGTALLLAVIGYVLYERDRVPLTDRGRLVLVPPVLEQMVADMSYNQLKVANAEAMLADDHECSAAVRGVGQRLVAAIDVDNEAPHLRNVEFKFHVVQCDEPNAFVLPNGAVFVYTGILPFMENTDGMAAVLGHELSHVVCRHSAEEYSYRLLPLLFVGALLPDGSLSAGVFELITNVLGHLPVSRLCESEADYVGLHLSSRAGYDPTQAVSVWQRFAEQLPNGASLLDTHPASADRAQNIRDWLPEMHRLYPQCRREQLTNG
jgi:metalloendopeptidase OMA1, mitochondrial